jgi:uncharacterized protein YggE
MVKTFLTVFSLFLACGTAPAADMDLPQVTVFGTATTMVTPNILTWNLTVRNIGLDLEDVANRHTEIVQTVLEILKKQGVAEEEIQTARMQFGDNIDRVTREKTGYYASTDIVFRIQDFTKYKSLWMGLARIENVGIQSVNYDHSNRIRFQDETRRNALLAARTKAETLAKTLGSGIGAPLLIEEDASAYPSYMTTVNDVRFSGNIDNSEILAPGKIPIRVRVKASFRLINPEP